MPRNVDADAHAVAVGVGADDDVGAFLVGEIDGHFESDLAKAFLPNLTSKPKVVIAKTVKGKGVSFVEGHGKWHHRIPNLEELELIYKELI